MLRQLLSLRVSDRTQRALILFSLLLILTLGFSRQFSVVRAATFTVTSAADDAPTTCDADCTLREAIIDANATGGVVIDIIEFNIGGGGSPQTISLTSALDPITGLVTIDGGTQTGGAACDAPPITLDGSGIVGAVNGLSITGDDTTISGLSITGFGSNGIDISSSVIGNNTITCNEITGNTGSGVNVVSGSGNRISANSIFANGTPDIQLNPGANNNQVAPILITANYNATDLTITGSLVNPIPTTFDLEYFVCAGTAEEGQLIHTATLGTAAISDTFAATLSTGAMIAVTATDPAGNTSEFSNCLTITEVPIYSSSPLPNDPTPINIGSSLVGVGVTRSDTVTISNIGAGNLDVSFTKSGPNQADFNIDTPSSTVLPGAPLDIAVTCTPSAVATLIATLTVTHNGTGTPVSPVTYELECTGTAAVVPDYESDPLPAPDPASTIDMGDSIVGVTLEVLDVITISNVGGATLNINSFTLTNTTEFVILNTPTSIGFSGADLDVGVRCTPNALGLRTTTLTINTNDPAQPGGDFVYTIRCNGIAGTPQYDSTPATGPLFVGGSLIGSPVTNASILTVRNLGTAQLDVTSVSVDNPAEFSVTPLSFNIPTGPTTQNISITCTPSLAGNRSTMLTISHNAGADATYTANCTGLQPVVLAPLTTTLSNGTQGTPYSQTFTATGGDGNYTFSSPSVLPAGSNLVGGVLSGTPTAAGTFTFTVVVTDTSTPTPLTDQKVYTLTIDPATPAVVLAPLTTTLSNGTQGTPYSQTFTATGGDGNYTFSSPSVLPAGLNLVGGVLSGTPTAAGTFTFTVVVTDTSTPTPLTDQKVYTLTIDPATPAVVLAPLTTTLPNGTQGTPYSQTFTATGGDGNYTFSSPSVLPAGLNLVGGVLSGTPTAAGTFTFTVVVTDTSTPTPLTDQKVYTLTIDPATPAVVLAPLTTTLSNGTQGTPYSQTFTATGGDGNYTFSSPSVLPAGLNLVGGILSGTPTAAGTFTFTVVVTDTSTPTPLTDQKVYTLTIDPATPAVVLAPLTTTLSNGTQGTPYSQTFTATGGDGNYTFSSPSVLPAGLNLVGGVLSGTPTAAGTFTFTVVVTDTSTPTPLTDQKVYTLTIDPATPAVVLAPLTTTLPNGTQGTPYSQTFTATGGDGNYTFSSPSVLPAGSNLVGGVLSGTPTAAGTFTFTVVVTDTSTPTPLTDQKVYTLTIDPAPSGAGYGSSPAVPGGTISITTVAGTPGNYTLTIQETGTADLTISNYAISGSPTALSVTGPSLPFTIANGGLAQTLTISCQNATPNTYSGTLTVTHNATGSPATYTVNCTVTAPGTGIYDSSPASPGVPIINIGTVQVGTAISYTLRVFNRGTGSLDVVLPGASPGLISGLHAADFAVTSNLPPFNVQGWAGSPNPFPFKDVVIRCIPLAAGPRQAALTFRIINDPTRSSIAYALNCTGSGTAVATVTPIGFVPTATAFVPTVTPVVPANGSVEEVKGLAMRTGPYLGATLIGKAIPGVAYPILAQSNDEGGGITWYLITVDTVTGWVSGLYLNVAGNIGIVPFQGSIFDQIDGAPDVGVTARAMSIIDIRRRPSGRAAILTQVPQDGIVRLLGRTRQNGGNFWVQVNYNGVIGWIPAAPIAVNGSTSNVPIR